MKCTSWRLAAGVAELPGSSELFRTYREVFAVMLGGPSGRVSKGDVRQLVDTMVDRDFNAFADLVRSKWQGRDVLTDMLDVVEESYGEDDSPSEAEMDDNDKLMVQRMIARLENAAPRASAV